MVTTSCKVLVEEGTERHDFAVADTKGRQVGASITFFVEEFTVCEAEPGKSWHRVEPGTYYSFVPRALRAGEHFGAWPGVTRSTTEAGRFYAVEKYLKGAKQRAVKNFGVKK